MSTILVVTEVKNGRIRKSALEAVSVARNLADAKGEKVTALLMTGAPIDTASLAAFGADQVLCAADGKLENYHPDFYKQVVLSAMEKTAPNVVLFSATNMGKDLAPRVAVAKNAVCMADCIAVEGQGDDLLVSKPLYAGKVLGKFLLKGDIKIISLRVGVFEAAESRPGAVVAEEPMRMPAVESRLELKQSGKSGAAKLDVVDAEIIVTGGRGLRAAENFVMVEELANALGGAVGATRAVVDSGWRPHSEQVGQTGKVVSPNLYIMIGASGSIQHWAGMSGSKCIVAINKDSQAPIMQRADYSIIGDLFEVLPALTAEIIKMRR